MEIKGTVAEVPRSTNRTGKAGQFHEEVLEMLAELKSMQDGEIMDVEFEDAKKAGVRAVSLRKAGYEAVTRGAHIFVKAGLKPDGGGEADDGDE